MCSVSCLQWRLLKLFYLRSMRTAWIFHQLVQFSLSVMSNFLWLHGLHHAKLPCSLPTARTCSNTRPLSWRCHPTISSSVVPFSFCLQSLPATGSFPMSQFFASGGQSIGSFSFNISPSNEYLGLISFRIDWLDLLADCQGIPWKLPFLKAFIGNYLHNV